MACCNNCKHQDEKQKHLCHIYGLCYYNSYTDYRGAFCESFVNKNYKPHKEDADGNKITERRNPKEYRP